MVKSNKFGFTLVELLAVIVILAIILVIAVPKIMSVIEDTKKSTLESTAKMIASQAEKAKVQNTLLGNTGTITCKDITNINDVDYERCIIEFDNDIAKVTIKGKGKFAGFNVCSGDKTTASVSSAYCNVSYGNGAAYIEKLEVFNGSENKLEMKSVEYNGTIYDAGIRYVGAMSDVNNKVYYNCDNKDASNVSYGEENYDYASSCEVWRIIGVFDTKSSTNGNIEKRIKIINTPSIFAASWDSNAIEVNSGYGINKWELSGSYEGADLMRLLNGYYIGKSDSVCKYCTGEGQATCEQTCTAESLKNANMKVLTSTAKGLIDNAVWDTYAVTWPPDDITDSSWAPTAYLQEKGISTQYTGKSLCESSDEIYCNDSITRTTNWTGLIGLMSVADIIYADGWLYNQSGTSLYPWSISPVAYPDCSSNVWYAYGSSANDVYTGYQRGVFASAYLKSDIKIIDGDGDAEPYKLSV